MLPPGHAAVGYLTFSILRRARYRDVPTDASIAWLLLGTQFPDLIDKPLAWGLGVLPSGRSLGHSLLFAIPVAILVDRWLRRRGQVAASQGFAVGYVTHLLTDALDVLPLFRGGLEWGSFMLWPVLESPDYGTEPSLWPPSIGIDPTGTGLDSIAPTVGPELALGAVVALVWIADGTPGLAYGYALRDRLTSR